MTIPSVWRANSFFAAGYFIILLIVNRRNINQQISGKSLFQ